MPSENARSPTSDEARRIVRKARVSPAAVGDAVAELLKE